MDALDTTRRSVLRRVGVLTYDLGQTRHDSRRLAAAEARGRFAVSASDDGVHFQSPWVPNLTCSARTTAALASNLELKGRYLRISHARNTTPISYRELQAFSDVPAVFPAGEPLRVGVPVADHFRNRTLLLGLCAVLFLLLVHRDMSRLRCLVLAASQPVGVWAVSDAWLVAWPVGAREVSLVRAVVAAVAAVAVAREAFAPYAGRRVRVRFCDVGRMWGARVLYFTTWTRPVLRREAAGQTPGTISTCASTIL